MDEIVEWEGGAWLPNLTAWALGHNFTSQHNEFIGMFMCQDLVS
jgi:hypothetical protein